MKHKNTIRLLGFAIALCLAAVTAVIQVKDASGATATITINVGATT